MAKKAKKAKPRPYTKNPTQRRGRVAGKPDLVPIYTEEEIAEMRRHVRALESRDQMTRIRARTSESELILRLGKEKCDAMFEILKMEI